jgi:hypothetical protein
MREDVPHRDNLKTTGLTSKEIADLELSEEEMAAVGGEDVPMTEEEKGALKTLGLTKKEGNKFEKIDTSKYTTRNINKHVENLIDSTMNSDGTYEDKMTNLYIIKNKLDTKFERFKEKYKDYIKDEHFVGLPEDAINEIKPTLKNRDEIFNVIASLKFRSPKKENIIV